MTESNTSIIRIILSAVLFVTIFRLISLDIVGIRGASMQPTLIPGETVMVNRLAYGLQIPLIDRYLFFWHPVHEGDIIVFESPLDSRSVIKRCIAVPGTPIEIKNETLYVSGKKYPLNGNTGICLSRVRNVPEEMVLAIGDNENRSIDSRTYGFVPIDSIRGRVVAERSGGNRD